MKYLWLSLALTNVALAVIAFFLTPDQATARVAFAIAAFAMFSVTEMQDRRDAR